MATNLVYLNDFGVVTCDAHITQVSSTDDGRTDVQLDQTCFYPRGGGQDWDTGTIRKDGAVLEVDEVRLDEAGVVHHLGSTTGEFNTGDDVQCSVDTERRAINTRLHSAGHLIDLAVDTLQLPWIPGKGAHYPHMSFVEYEAEVRPEEAGALAAKIEQLTNEAVAEGGDNEIRFMPVSEMHAVCRHVPENIPANKPARVVIYHGNFGVPCGGTHVANLHQIGTIHITKVKTKKGITKVSYAIEGINAD
jgi:Ser-tRNA(Ala) deacylase AlaX